MTSDNSSASSSPEPQNAPPSTPGLPPSVGKSVLGRPPGAGSPSGPGGPPSGGPSSAGGPSGAGPGGPPSGARGRWVMRDRPGVLWLLLAALITLVHPFLPGSRWLMVHLVMLGALTHSMVVWSTHFTQALLKTKDDVDPRPAQNRRLILLFGSVCVVCVSMPLSWRVGVIVGALGVVVAVGDHAYHLHRRLRVALPGRFRITVRYYLAAAACLALGAFLGATVAHVPHDPEHAHLLLAHSLTMLLGWVGLTVVGTLTTLWPTMLRTRIHPRAESVATLAWPVLLVATVVSAAGAAFAQPWVLIAGLTGYLAGVGWWGWTLCAPTRAKPPRVFATVSVLCALSWVVVAVLWLLVALVQSAVSGSADALVAVASSYGPIVACLVVGGALQLLTGALSYLVPTVLGGGPLVVRAGQAVFNRFGTVRLVLINVGLAICVLRVPSAVRVVASTLVLVGLVWFIPLMVKAIRAAVAARSQGDVAERTTSPLVDRSVWSLPQAAFASVLLLLAGVVGVVVDPAAAGFARGPSVTVPATGRTTTVKVLATKDMRFEPSSISVPAGDVLTIELVNTDPTTTHDLVLASGASTSRLAPGASAVLDAGVQSTSQQGWCSIIGHKQMGMTLTITVQGGLPPGGLSAGHHGGSLASAPHLDLHQKPAPGFTAQPAVLPPLTPEKVRTLTLKIEEVDLEIAPGVKQRRWTFGGAVPGPTLHGRVGDVFEITLVNNGTMGHSIDFHAGALAPNGPMRTIPPGQSLVYRFTAGRAGIWMYHCSTMPMSVHIAAGMHGAVIIEPPDLPPVATQYALVQSEVFAGAATPSGALSVDAAKVAAEKPDAVVFNGVASQYDHQPLHAKVGERVRFWVLDAGPNRASAFHVVGGQFDTVYYEGAYLLKPGGSGGSQALALGAATGGFVELTFPEPGRYPFVSHVMVDAERGAHGFVDVTR